MRASAAIFEKLYTPFTAADMDIDEPGPGEVLVRIVAVGDKVVIGWPWCGFCRNCLEGQPRYCLSLGPLVVSGGRDDGAGAVLNALRPPAARSIRWLGAVPLALQRSGSRPRLRRGRTAHQSGPVAHRGRPSLARGQRRRTRCLRE